MILVLIEYASSKCSDCQPLPLLKTETNSVDVQLQSIIRGIEHFQFHIQMYICDVLYIFIITCDEIHLIQPIFLLENTKFCIRLLT